MDDDCMTAEPLFSVHYSETVSAFLGSLCGFCLQGIRYFDVAKSNFRAESLLYTTTDVYNTNSAQKTERVLNYVTKVQPK